MKYKVFPKGYDPIIVNGVPTPKEAILLKRFGIDIWSQKDVDKHKEMENHCHFTDTKPEFEWYEVIETGLDNVKVNNLSLEQELQKLGIDDWTIFHISEKVYNEAKEYGKKEYYRGYKVGKEEGVSELKENLQEFLKCQIT